MVGHMDDFHMYDCMDVLVFHQCQRGGLLKVNDYIIVLSMMSNLLTVGEMISKPTIG